MAKEVLKQAGVAAFEKVMQGLLPQLMARFDQLSAEIASTRTELRAELRSEIGSVRTEIGSVRTEIASVHKEVADLRRDMDLRFERTQELINELGLRINSTATKVDGFQDFVHRSSVNVDDFRERLVRVEEIHKYVRPNTGLRLVIDDEPPTTSRRKSSRRGH